MKSPLAFWLPSFVASLSLGVALADDANVLTPHPDEQQLPLAMHSQMQQLPRITVGHQDAALIGRDNRALQAAVDYIAALGGGTVEIVSVRQETRDPVRRQEVCPSKPACN